MLVLSKHEIVITHAIKRAAEEGIFEVQCPSISVARSARVQAYNLIKKVRTYVGKHPAESLALEILEHADDVSFGVCEVDPKVSGGPAIMTIQRKDLSGGIMAIASALEAVGIAAKEEIVDPEMAAAMARMVAVVKGRDELAESRAKLEKAKAEAGGTGA